MKETPKKVIITRNDEFEIKDRTSPKPVNLELLNKWTIKDHTKPRDVKIKLPDMTGTFDHRELQHRDAADQHPISAIEGLQTALDAKMNISDFNIIYCGTSTEVI